jgi:anti-sigma factor RsiW
MTPRDDSHAEHDPLLISAYVAGNAEGADRTRAAEIVETCKECAALAADLRAIAAALPTSAVAPRPRDFRLTEAQLGQASRARWSFDRVRAALRPAGASLATLGVAGLLLAGMSGLGGQAAELSTVGTAIGGAPGAGNGYDSGAGSGADGAQPSAVAAPAASAAASAAPAPQVGSKPAASTGTTGERATDKSAGLPTVGPIPPQQPASGPPPIVIASVGFLGAGVVLLVASALVRRRDGPAD